MATSFTTHSTGQVITAADINLIQTAVNALENAPAGSTVYSDPPVAAGFKTWTFDSVHMNGNMSFLTGDAFVCRFYAASAYTVTNFHTVQYATSALPTNYFAAMYNAAGTLLSTSSNQASTAGTVGVKTFPLAAAQAVTAGSFYYGLIWANGGTMPQTAAERGLAGGAAALPVLTANGAIRYGYIDLSLTTTAPANLTGMVTWGQPWWMAVS